VLIGESTFTTSEFNYLGNDQWQLTLYFDQYKAGAQEVVIELADRAIENYITSEDSVKAASPTAPYFGVNNNKVVHKLFLTVYQYSPDIPDLITPNGDGANDKWIILGLDDYKEFQLEVFDSRGITLFSTSNQNYQEWDGTYKGNIVPDGTYYYRLKVVPNEIEIPEEHEDTVEIIEQPEEFEITGKLTVVR
jgi:gliding motility-associated-like protein